MKRILNKLFSKLVLGGLIIILPVSYTHLAVAAPEEIRGKDSRGNNDRRNNNNNHRKDHAKLGGKKQEN